MKQYLCESERMMHLLTLCKKNLLSAAGVFFITVLVFQPLDLAYGADKETEALRKRVEQLEEQIVDMQVVIGTLQSLGGRSGASAAAGNYAGGGVSTRDSARIDNMEMQIRALTAQLERTQRSPQTGGATDQSYQGYNDNYSTELPDRRSRVRQQDGFGSTTVTQQIGQDPIGGYINDQLGNDRSSPTRPNAARQTQQGQTDSRQYAARGETDFSNRPREIVGGNPKALYETAYGYLLQQDYGAAEVAFLDFLQRYPSDKLSGNAQYWLGESHYVRGQYKSAAGAFLKGYQTYSKSAKAPDSLLKLAMSLDRLGQKDAACSSYTELVNRFPNAPAHVKNRAASERRRVGC
ncbi:MAG: tol-pal system protein YbgF [Hyphomicrobiaceae bacterium]